MFCSQVAFQSQDRFFVSFSACAGIMLPRCSYPLHLSMILCLKIKVSDQSVCSSSHDWKKGLLDQTLASGYRDLLCLGLYHHAEAAVCQCSSIPRPQIRALLFRSSIIITCPITSSGSCKNSRTRAANMKETCYCRERSRRSPRAN